MAISLPLVINDQLAGTSFIAGGDEKNIALVTTLHQIRNGDGIHIAIPAHFGNVSRPQPYPIIDAPLFQVNLGLAEPFLDLAILLLPRFPDLVVSVFLEFH